MVESTVIASSPTISISQITTLADFKFIKSLFFRKVRNTCQAVSSELKQPMPMALPSASTAVGTNTRLGLSAITVPLMRSPSMLM